MKKTNAQTLAAHLTDDLGIQPSDTIFLFSGVWGLGKLENGLDDITDAFRLAIPQGLLLIPTFSYTWCSGETWDPAITPCPDMGVYADHAWRGADFVRTDNPNFSVTALRTAHNAALIDTLFQVDDDCFGEHSIFGNLVRHSRTNPRTFVLLLGGAFKDCLFRCTFIHYAQQRLKVPNRFIKPFPDPAGSGRVVTQLVRMNTAEEYVQTHGQQPPADMPFPAYEDFGPYGPSLEKAGALIRAPFRFYESRMAPVAESVDIFEAEWRADPSYCMAKPTPEATE
ncbi:AAC(3) family N-acetyltransferase [Magnetofaba australis]|uniref:Aminoglycoside N(3)-acetyltransferase n=1 Tax=Magnetofaba australis IT-1 TaxID=1434232 RepID=A0A1Y2K2M8_9PROT|nr:AAC(3) family N-acetyltransferase [Magnetofaba australis]OSM02288.1 putative aminoglycoside N3-acetyltransferase [Magnetofaba australis IT-1]